MRLTQHTDFALRVLIHLALHREGRVTTAEIAEDYGISLHHLHKVVRELGRLGLVELRRGKGGGMSLLREPDEISIGAVVRKLEPPTDLLECFDPARDECAISRMCGLKPRLGRAMEAFYRELDDVHLEDVTGGRAAEQLRKALKERG